MKKFFPFLMILGVLPGNSLVIISDTELEASTESLKRQNALNEKIIAKEAENMLNYEHLNAHEKKNLSENVKLSKERAVGYAHNLAFYFKLEKIEKSFKRLISYGNNKYFDNKNDLYKKYYKNVLYDITDRKIEQAIKNIKEETKEEIKADIQEQVKIIILSYKERIKGLESFYTDIYLQLSDINSETNIFRSDVTFCMIMTRFYQEVIEDMIGPFSNKEEFVQKCKEFSIKESHAGLAMGLQNKMGPVDKKISYGTSMVRTHGIGNAAMLPFMTNETK